MYLLLPVRSLIPRSVSVVRGNFTVITMFPSLNDLFLYVSIFVTQIWLGASRYHVGSYWGASDLCPGLIGSWWSWQWPLPSSDLLTSGAQASGWIPSVESSLCIFTFRSCQGVPVATVLRSRGLVRLTDHHLVVDSLGSGPSPLLGETFHSRHVWWTFFSESTNTYVRHPFLLTQCLC